MMSAKGSDFGHDELKLRTPRTIQPPPPHHHHPPPTRGQRWRTLALRGIPEQLGAAAADVEGVEGAEGEDAAAAEAAGVRRVRASPEHACSSATWRTA